MVSSCILPCSDAQDLDRVISKSPDGILCVREAKRWEFAKNSQETITASIKEFLVKARNDLSCSSVHTSLTPATQKDIDEQIEQLESWLNLSKPFSVEVTDISGMTTIRGYSSEAENELSRLSVTDKGPRENTPAPHRSFHILGRMACGIAACFGSASATGSPARPLIGRGTALVYDDNMRLHEHPGKGHPECPDRILFIFRELQRKKLLGNCVHLPIQQARMEDLVRVHQQEHVEKVFGFKEYDGQELQYMAYQYNSVYLNEHSTDSALTAAGGVAAVVTEVAQGRAENGVAVVRPPGHHAEASHCMGFCLINNVAVAASLARAELGMERVLIIDWDIHHGNGTQEMFEDDPNVLFMSIHRYDNGSFYPGGKQANCSFVGIGPGKGYTVNVAWNETDDSTADKICDEDYVYTFEQLVMPIATRFDPQLVRN